MINVTKSFLPPLEEYYSYLQGIWDCNQLTNNGPLLQELEEKLKEHLHVRNIIFISNGTIALQIAIRALELTGEIITTPFSYVATTSSIIWEGCNPVFVDIDPKTFCINPDLIEEAITSRTTAIMPTHVYGIPCDVKKIETIAQRYSLKVIYDAAHAFGVKYLGKALASFGDISVLSFHATKLFHTVEGGAVVTENDEIAKKINYMRNFGHKGQEDFWGLGTNGKNTEFHAAMGLSILPHINEILRSRRQVCEQYDQLINNSNLSKPSLPENTTYNFAYYPVLFPSEVILLAVKSALIKNEIYPRRYFYPALHNLPYLNSPINEESEDISKRVLCLPLYAGLDSDDVSKILEIIKHNI